MGVLGYMSPDALFASDNFRMDMQFIGYSFKEGGNQYPKLVELAAEQSAMLKRELKCDIVVVVIHGGHADDEDVGLLNLPDVDIVLGGHTHESYLYSSSEGSSITSQCGCCGGQLTALSVGMDTANRTLHFRGVDEEYSRLVSADYPQCIKITSKLNGDDDFDKKVSSWKGEIKDLVGIDQDKVIFRGDLTQLLRPSISREDNAWVFAHMLVDQFNKWERKNNPGYSDLVTLTFWNKDFLAGYDQGCI